MRITSHARLAPSPGRRLLAVTAAGLLVLGLAACGSSESDEPEAKGSDEAVTLRIAHTASAAHLPVAVADAEGFFEDHGIKTELTQLGTAAFAQAPSLVGRQYDVAFGTEPVFLTAVRSGLDIKIVGGSFLEKSSIEDTLLLASPESGVKSLTDLRGKRVGAPSMSGNLNLSTQAAIKKAGVDLDDVKFVQVDTANMPDSLKAGRIDAAEVTSPVSGALVGQGYVKLTYPPAAVGDPVNQALWMADAKWADENTDVIKSYVAALDEAIAWIEKNPEDALELLIERSKVPPQYESSLVMPAFSATYSPENLKKWADTITYVNGEKFNLDFTKLIAEPAR